MMTWDSFTLVFTELSTNNLIIDWQEMTKVALVMADRERNLLRAIYTSIYHT